MRKIADIRTFEDRSLLRWVSRASVRVLAAAVVLCAALTAALALGAPAALDPAVAGILSLRRFSAGGVARWVLALGAVPLVALVAHELVHALFFKLFAPRGVRVTFGANWAAGMIFACAEGIVYTRRQYLAIAASPSVIVSAALLAAGLVLANPVLALGTAGIHLCGCTGDWYYIRAILRDPEVTHCEDTTWGVRFFGDGEEARA